MRLPDQKRLPDHAPDSVGITDEIGVHDWQRSPLNIALVILLASALSGLGVWFCMVITLPLVAIGGCYWMLAFKAYVPPLHELARACVLGEAIWVFVSACYRARQVPYRQRSSSSRCRLCWSPRCWRGGSRSAAT